MAQSTISKPSTYHEVELLAWGTYITLNSTYTLSDSLRNYQYLRFQCGSASDQTSGGGAMCTEIPTTIIGEYGSSGAQVGLDYSLNGEHFHVAIQFQSATTFKIVGLYNITKQTTNMVSGIRRVTGVRF